MLRVCYGFVGFQGKAWDGIYSKWEEKIGHDGSNYIIVMHVMFIVYDFELIQRDGKEVL